MKVLLLTAATGGGHARAAEALAECLERKHPDWETVIADSLKCISPVVDKMVVGSYISTVKNIPGLYGTLYDLSEKGMAITDLTRALNRLLSYRFRSYIEDVKPSVIICTHSIPLQMLSSLKRANRINIPVIGIVTDFTSHLFWKLNGVDALVVAHGHIKEDMVDMGIPSPVIHTYGIPVSSAFYKKGDRRRLLSELGLRDKPTLLIMGGSLGFGQVKDIFKSLLKYDRDIQLIAVTGRNERLRKQLEELSQGCGKRVIVLGYTYRVHDLMDVADFIITKPGGVTVSEALVKRLPIVITPPIPGQEERNARFLEGEGAAVRLPDESSLERVLYPLMNDPERIAAMKKMAGLLACPNAGEDIVGLVEELAYSNPPLVAGYGPNGVARH